MCLYGLNLRTPGQWPSWFLGPSLNKLGRGSLGNATYQIASIWAMWFWQRRFLNIFLSFSMIWTQDHLSRGHLGPWDLGFSKLGKEQPGNATYPISSTWAKQFLRRKCLSIFHFWTQDPPLQGHFGPQCHHLNKLGSGLLGNATYQISRP